MDKPKRIESKYKGCLFRTGEVHGAVTSARVLPVRSGATSRPAKVGEESKTA